MSCRCGYRKQLLEKRNSHNFKTSTYLDYNASAPLDPAVIGAFEKNCREDWSNPASLHSGGIQAWKKIEEARAALAEYFRWPSAESVFFCSGGTEGLRTLIDGFAVGAGLRPIITTASDHASVYRPLRILRMSGRRDIRIIGVDSSGKVVPEELEEAASGQGPGILIYSPVNHETGAIQDTALLYKTVKSRGGLVFLDAVQAAARLKPSLWAPFCDGFVISGHKIYAPKGTGALLLKPGVKLPRGPNLLPAAQVFFPGTPNSPGIAALAQAVRLLDPDKEGVYLRALIKDLFFLLEKAGIDYKVFSPKDSAPGVACLRIPDIQNMEGFFSFLQDRDICLSRFSACTGRISGSSRVLASMGFSPEDCRTSLRLSLGRFSKRKDLITFITAAEDFISRQE